MVEGTPGQPYTSSCPQFRRVQTNMKLRREQVEALLKVRAFLAGRAAGR